MGAIVKSSSVWKTMDSSVTVRSVPASVPAEMVSGSAGVSARRKRSVVVAAVGASS